VAPQRWIGRDFDFEVPLEERGAVLERLRAVPAQLEDVTRGLTEGGIEVMDIGEVPTPLMYFAADDLNTGAGLMVTGGHHDANLIGMRFVLNGMPVCGAALARLKKRLDEGQLTQGEAESEEIEVVDAYVDRILDDVAIAQSIKLVLDAGNGVVGTILPLRAVWTFGDVALGLMSFPNLLALIVLSGSVVSLTRQYFAREHVPFRDRQNGDRG